MTGPFLLDSSFTPFVVKLDLSFMSFSVIYATCSHIGLIMECYFVVVNFFMLKIHSHIKAQISSKKVVEFTPRETLTLEATMASMDLYSIGNVFKEIHISNLKTDNIVKVKS
jgi:hypothetical protein